MPSLLNKESTIAEWMEDPRGKEVIAPIIEQMIAVARKKISGNSKIPKAVSKWALLNL
jgi:beta-glucosidase